MDTEKEIAKKPKEVHWIPTDIHMLSTGQLARILQALLNRLDLKCQHTVEKGVLNFRLVDDSEAEDPTRGK